MIEVIEHGRVRELRLARPPANALSPELLAEIGARVAAAPAEGAAALVLSGAEGMFTGGLDVPLLLGLDRAGLKRALETFFGAMAALAASELPVAAAITGHSPAGGAVLSLFCDWRVMAEGPYVVGFNEVRIGIPMPAVVADALTRVVGRRQAERLCQTGSLMSPAEALAIGLVDRVTPVERVVEEAVEWCAALAELPAHALRGTRRTVRADLVAIVERSRSADVESLVAEWFRPEVQGPLAALAAKLGAR
ncbi:MAG: enoyl-CoA hydratase/isomerase family protein [Thermoanaerobaculales bacterium]|jgi:enoyl-CoA hydratase/carnithine racemase|nr:enoyl-CoA hydratase/isomerase family protein [Thermoanaerobaculales bacterium]